MYSLTNEQKQDLLDIVIDGLGHELPFSSFADVLMGQFEDIPGFETIPAETAALLINELWRTYHGQKST